MRHRNAIALCALVLVAFAVRALAATVASSTVSLAGLPPIVLTANGESVAVSGADTSGSPTKKCIVLAWTVDSRAVKVLARFENRNGKLFVDLVSAVSIAELTTTTNAMDLSTIPGHPSPAKDRVDTSAITAAGG
jgi:hypothetical protein